MGYTGNTDRGPVARLLAARRTEKACIRAGVNTVLHTGTFDLPGTAGGKGLERYLLCDSTWDLAARYSTEISHYSSKSLRVSDRLEIKALKGGLHVFPIAHYVKDNLISHYGVNPGLITVVGTGRGKIAPFHGKKDYASGPILFAAKDRFKEKGGRLLLEGFQIANKKNSSIKLVLAGKAVEDMALPGMPNVTVAGHVAWEELQRLFETAALFAMPAYNEPWGLVYLEALACRTPILGLARNSLPEITQNGRFGFLVEKPDPKFVAEALLRACVDPKGLEQMGSEGQEQCLAAYSWRRTAGLILERMKAGRAV
ncbi:MAG TPA: glycosyltransferase family 4 protein [Verrucomicrobiae bacterium]|jgi:glycosyltransferase involved in cell wall biosynthesis|nr:glycosyltransferase family 4 protein [Verrucomicrobiae bacterium]